MKYSDYKVDDFLKDDFFVSWVKSKDLHAEKFWKRWLLENPDKYDIVNEASQIINSIQYEKNHQLDDKEYITLYENIVNGSRVIKTPTEERFKPSYQYGIAASIVLLVVSWFIINNWTNSTSNVTTPVAMVTKVVSNGQKMTVRLSDGTSIKLNSNSKISYPESFSSQERHVQLEGEAFFDVAKDASRPFTITSGDVSTTVLGTSFNIRAFPESNIKVSVLTGKVRVDAADFDGGRKELILLPEDMAIYSQERRQFEKTSFSQLQEMAWKDGILHFQDMNIHQVTSELTKWYGVSFDINKAVDTQKDYTGSFNNQPLEEVLKGLSFVFGFDFEIDNKTVTII